MTQDTSNARFNPTSSQTTHSNREETIHRLKRAIDAVQSLPRSDREVKELAETLQKLENRQQMVAVFGAFSAGKSSLLNAFAGQSLLAVSPNPTTAAVTHILGRNAKDEAELERPVHQTLSNASSPATSETARVYAKTESQIWEDIRQTFSGLHLEVANLADGIQQASVLKMTDFPAGARKSVSFLTAVASGWADMQSRLGTAWMVEGEDVHKYTADERFACFIHRVDIFRDSISANASFPVQAAVNSMNTPILPESLVLVDTPGVDSIHRRHTDVAFDYMRQADAILFVVYYTHALSRADADFLQQLAGVQDVTGTNKLFVVINAVDLAKSTEERQAVYDRVVQELKRLGIRQPRVFEVSSQLGFAAKRMVVGDRDPFEHVVRHRLGLSEANVLPAPEELYRTSGLEVLEADLLHYIEQEHDLLADDAAFRTIRHVKSTVDGWIQRNKRRLAADAEELAAEQTAKADWKVKLQAQIEHWTNGRPGEFAQIDSDLTELIFHIGERIRIKFPTLFRESFHPGRFRIGKNTNAELKAGADELTRSLERQIEIETRTFALRAVALIKMVGMQILNRLYDQLRQFDEFAGQSLDFNVDAAFADAGVRAKLIEKPIEAGFRHFSSAKQFFEQSGQSQMLDQVSPEVLFQVKEEIEVLCTHVSSQAHQAFRQGVLDILNSAVKTLEIMPNAGEYTTEGAIGVEIGYDDEQMEQVAQQLESFLQTMKK